MNTQIAITAIVAVAVTVITARICATIDRAVSAPKVIRLAFDKGGAFGFQPKGGEE